MEQFSLRESHLLSDLLLNLLFYNKSSLYFKDFKSKNIFIENGKIVITDFGLVNVTLSGPRSGGWLYIPAGWLCYLAPEIMRSLSATPQVMFIYSSEREY